MESFAERYFNKVKLEKRLKELEEEKKNTFNWDVSPNLFEIANEAKMALLGLQRQAEAQKKAKEAQKEAWEKAKEIQLEAERQSNLQTERRLMFGEKRPGAISLEAIEESYMVEISANQRKIPVSQLIDLMNRRRLVAENLIHCKDDCTQKNLLVVWREHNNLIKQLLAI